MQKTGNKSCVIVVHIYEKKFSYIEELAIKNLFEKLGGKYDIIAIYPEELDLTYYKQNFDFTGYLKVYGLFFCYPYGYNYLMMNKNIYLKFSEYKYMLIHHPDAWIFDDNLEYWINKDYDILGTPILYGAIENGYDAQQIYYRIHKVTGCPVQQGGLSLRKISWMIKNIEKHPYNHLFDNKDDYYMDDNRLCYIHTIGYEDIFIASHFDFENSPNIIECVKFCGDPYNVINYFFINNYKMPFGIHGIVSKSNKTIIQEELFNFSKNIGIFDDKLNYNQLKL